MARPKDAVPSYLHHKASDDALCFVDGRQVYLGNYGSPESRQEYQRVIGGLEAKPGHSVGDVSLVELCAAYLDDIDGYYSPNEQRLVTQATQLSLDFWGDRSAAGFGSVELMALRQAIVKPDWSRKFVNEMVGRIKRVLRWGLVHRNYPAEQFTAVKDWLA